MSRKPESRKPIPVGKLSRVGGLRSYSDYKTIFGEEKAIRLYLLDRESFSKWRITTPLVEIDGSFLGDECALGEMIVNAMHRGKGIGTKFWRLLESVFRERGVKILRGQAAVTALPFWLKMGFEEIGYVETDVWFMGEKTEVHHIRKVLE